MKKPIIIKFADASKLPHSTITLEPGSSYHELLSISLFGEGTTSYGKYEAQNLLHTLERFAADVPPINPTEGQLWFNRVTGELMVAYTKVQYIPESPANPPLQPFPIPEQMPILDWRGIGAPILANLEPTAEKLMWYDVVTGEMNVHNDVGDYEYLGRNYLPLSGSSEPHMHMRGDLILNNATALEVQGRSTINAAIFNDVAHIPLIQIKRAGSTSNSNGNAILHDLDSTDAYGANTAFPGATSVILFDTEDNVKFTGTNEVNIKNDNVMQLSISSAAVNVYPNQNLKLNNNQIKNVTSTAPNDAAIKSLHDSTINIITEGVQISGDTMYSSPQSTITTPIGTILAPSGGNSRLKFSTGGTSSDVISLGTATTSVSSLGGFVISGYDNVNMAVLDASNSYATDVTLLNGTRVLGVKTPPANFPADFGVNKKYVDDRRDLVALSNTTAGDFGPKAHISMTLHNGILLSAWNCTASFIGTTNWDIALNTDSLFDPPINVSGFNIPSVGSIVSSMGLTSEASGYADGIHKFATTKTTASWASGNPKVNVKVTFSYNDWIQQNIDDTVNHQNAMNAAWTFSPPDVTLSVAFYW